MGAKRITVLPQTEVAQALERYRVGAGLSRNAANARAGFSPAQWNRLMLADKPHHEMTIRAAKAVRADMTVILDLLKVVIVDDDSTVMTISELNQLCEAV